MWVEHLKFWLAAERAEEKADPSRWWIVVDMVWLAFETGDLEK